MRALGVVAAILLFSTGARAQETDNFTNRGAMRAKLKDGGPKMDAWVNGRLEMLEKILHERKPKTESERLDCVRKAFESSIGPEYFSPAVDYLNGDSEIPQYYVKNRGIYGGKMDYGDSGFAWYVGLSPSMKLHGALIGTDKVGHFFGQGLDYYGRFIANRKGKAAAEARALEALRQYGDETEKGALGLGTDRVYSCADLASNWTGFSFYRSLFEGKDSYFAPGKDGSLRKRRDFTFKDYVTDDWDEALNPSVVRDEATLSRLRGNMESPCREYRSDPAKYLGASGRQLRKQDYLVPSAIEAQQSTRQISVQTLCPGAAAAKAGAPEDRRQTSSDVGRSASPAPKSGAGQSSAQPVAGAR